MSRSLLATAPLFALAIAVFVPAAAIAEPPPWAGGWRAAHAERPVHRRHTDYRVVYAPTTRVAYTGIPVARGLPYGFNRGTCDRGLLGGRVVGVAIGGAVGRAMDRHDRGCVARALDHLPDRRRIVWTGVQGGEYGVIPLRSTQDEGGRTCREYQAMARIGGDLQQVFGTACRQPDGQWTIVD